MKTFTVYDLVTGFPNRNGYVLIDSDAVLQAGSGEGVLLDVRLNSETHRVDPATKSVILYSPPPPSLDSLKSVSKAQVAQRRWEIETGGMPFGGSVVATDDRSKLLLSSAASRAAADPNFTAQWKMLDGTWVTLNSAAFTALYTALFTWVSNCFAREEALGVLVDASADQTALNGLSPTIAKFWP